MLDIRAGDIDQLCPDRAGADLNRFPPASTPAVRDRLGHGRRWIGIDVAGSIGRCNGNQIVQLLRGSGEVKGLPWSNGHAS